MANYLIFNQEGGGLGDTEKIVVNRDHVKYVSYIAANQLGLKLNSGSLITIQLSGNEAPAVIDSINDALKANPSGKDLEVKLPAGITISSSSSVVAPSSGAENLGDLNDVFRDVSSALPRDNSLMLGGYSSSLGTIGDGLIYIGNPDTNSGYTSSGGFHSVVVGMDAGKNGLAANMVIIGNEAGNGGVPGTPFNAGSGGTQSVIIGSDAVEGGLGALIDSVCIGYKVCKGGFTNSSLTGGFITSIRNVIIGDNSGPESGPTTMSYGTIVGSNSGKQQQNVIHNTIVGSEAGNTLTTGTNNTILGFSADSSTATVSNEFTLGNSSVATLRCAVTSITSLSDERDKKDITDLEYGLDFIESLQPKQFTWDNRPEIQKVSDVDENGDLKEVEKEIESANKGKKDFGFIAQDVQPLDNDVLRLVYDENPDKLEMSYGKLVPILVKAVKELSDKVKALEAK